MTYQEIAQKLIDSEKNPNDFKITFLEKGYKIEPRASYEPRQIAREEDRPIITDVNEVAETTTYMLIDNMSVAETLALALVKIDALESEISMLKGV